MFQIGKFKVTPLEFGRFKLDGGAMFGVVPKVLWEKKHPADDRNQIEMALRCLLIETEDRKILVDTGFGEGRADKFKKIYQFSGSETYLAETLSEAGLNLDQITDVVLTHLHFDHGGGSTIDKQSDPKPAFPNARYYIQKNQVDHARERFERDKASYFPEDFEPLIENGNAVIKDGPWELVPGLDTIVCNGHTPGMQLVRISDENKTVIYGADLIPLASQFTLPWIMSYDLYPVTTLEEKKKLLAEAATKGWIFIFEHDPVYLSGKVAINEKGGYSLIEPNCL